MATINDDARKLGSLVTMELSAKVDGTIAAGPNDWGGWDLMVGGDPRVLRIADQGQGAYMVQVLTSMEDPTPEYWLTLHGVSPNLLAAVAAAAW